MCAKMNRVRYLSHHQQPIEMRMSRRAYVGIVRVCAFLNSIFPTSTAFLGSFGSRPVMLPKIKLF